MKKLLLIFAFIAIAIPVSAQSDIMFNLGSGSFGLGFNFPLNDAHQIETSVSVLTVGIEERNTHLGIALSPFKYYAWGGSTDYGDARISGISLANFNVYWHPLTVDFGAGSIYLGPFSAIDFLFVGEEVEWGRYVFTGGAHFGLRTTLGGLNYNIFDVEMGYRNIDGVSKYYIGTKVDALLLIVAFLYVFS